MKLNKSIIGMIHVDALAGTPHYKGSFQSIVDKALDEACTYQKAGIDILMIENMFDVPYMNRKVGPEITASMAVIAREIKREINLPLGMQILAGANNDAMAASLVSGADFISAEGFVFSHIADEGQMDACAGELMRYRKEIGAQNVKVFCDIKKKHSSHALTSDVDIVETAKAAEFFLSDGVIVTGASTGAIASVDELKATKAAVKIPVLIGSGVTLDNVDQYLAYADAIIVGSHFKEGGFWRNPVSEKIVKRFMEKVASLR